MTIYIYLYLLFIPFIFTNLLIVSLKFIFCDGKLVVVKSQQKSVFFNFLLNFFKVITNLNQFLLFRN